MKHKTCHHTVTAPHHTITAPHHTVTAPHHTVTAPHHTVTAPHHTVTAPHHTITARLCFSYGRKCAAVHCLQNEWRKSVICCRPEVRRTREHDFSPQTVCACVQCVHVCMCTVCARVHVYSVCTCACVQCVHVCMCTVCACVHVYNVCMCACVHCVHVCMCTVCACVHVYSVCRLTLVTSCPSNRNSLHALLTSLATNLCLEHTNTAHSNSTFQQHTTRSIPHAA